MTSTGGNQVRPATEERASRDLEDRRILQDDERARREENLDKTVADSFPTSDPPSTIPDPSGDA